MHRIILGICLTVSRGTLRLLCPRVSQPALSHGQSETHGHSQRNRLAKFLRVLQLSHSGSPGRRHKCLLAGVAGGQRLR